MCPLRPELLDEAMKYAGVRSKRAVVHEALATYVAVKSEEQRRAVYRDRLTDLRARLLEGPRRTPVQKLIRADRERAS